MSGFCYRISSSICISVIKFNDITLFCYQIFFFLTDEARQVIARNVYSIIRIVILNSNASSEDLLSSKWINTCFL